jgi:hypothetical protein
VPASEPALSAAERGVFYESAELKGSPYLHSGSKIEFRMRAQTLLLTLGSDRPTKNALEKKWNTREKLGNPSDLELLQKTFDRMK